MLPVIMVYAGLAVAFVGLVWLIRPLSFLGIRRRGNGAIVLVLGVGIVAVAFALPITETRMVLPRTELDQFVPAYQFSEFHSIVISAPPGRVFEAVEGVTSREIPLFRTLTWIRRGGMPLRAGILNPPPDEPILDVALRREFILLARDPNREIVIGTAVIPPGGWRYGQKLTPEEFRLLRGPGLAIAAMNFRLEDAGGGATLLTTETRVYASGEATQRKFALYWRVIYPGSALIRRMWLLAIRRRAEGRRE